MSVDNRRDLLSLPPTSPVATKHNFTLLQKDRKRDGTGGMAPILPPSREMKQTHSFFNFGSRKEGRIKISFNLPATLSLLSNTGQSIGSRVQQGNGSSPSNGKNHFSSLEPTHIFPRPRDATQENLLQYDSPVRKNFANLIANHDYFQGWTGSSKSGFRLYCYCGCCWWFWLWEGFGGRGFRFLPMGVSSSFLR